MKVNEQFQNLKQLLAAAEEDALKASTGNGAAGTRLRKQMQAVKSAAQDVRHAVLESKKQVEPEPTTPNPDQVEAPAASE